MGRGTYDIRENAKPGHAGTGAPWRILCAEDNIIFGSSVVQTDYDGEVVWSADYAPFGESLEEQPINWGNPYTFLGNEDDGGLMDFGARWYDPRIGRFYSCDPIKKVDTANACNPYVYCDNNPLRYTDKFGMNKSGPEQVPEPGMAASSGGGSGGYPIGNARDTGTGWIQVYDNSGFSSYFNIEFKMGGVSEAQAEALGELLAANLKMDKPQTKSGDKESNPKPISGKHEVSITIADNQTYINEGGHPGVTGVNSPKDGKVLVDWDDVLTNASAARETIGGDPKTKGYNWKDGYRGISGLGGMASLGYGEFSNAEVKIAADTIMHELQDIAHSKETSNFDGYGPFKAEIDPLIKVYRMSSAYRENYIYTNTDYNKVRDFYRLGGPGETK